MTLRGFIAAGQRLRHQGPRRCPGHRHERRHRRRGSPSPTSTRSSATSGSTAIQQRMPQVWDGMRLNEEGESVVVIPSVTLDRVTERSGSLGQAMEERFLFLLLLLREPRLRMVYVTSMPISPVIVEYYLALAAGHHPEPRPGAAVAGVGQRLVAATAEPEAAGAAAPVAPASAELVPTGRGRTSCPTTRRRSSATSRSPSASRCTAPTPAVRAGHQDRLPPAVRGGGSAGTRSASRTCAASTIWSTRRCELRRPRPTIQSAIVKLNEGVSGEGNATGRPAWTADPRVRRTSASAVGRAAADMSLRSPGHAVSTRTSPSSPNAAASSRSCIVGHRSAQPQRAAAGGPRRQGRAALHARPAARRSQRPELPRLPVPGRLRLCAGDQRRGDHRRRAAGPRRCPRALRSRFRCRRRTTRGDWTSYAIEINLRKGGTTHPFLTLQFLTDGRYDAATGLFMTPAGREKHLVATDHFESRSAARAEPRRPVRHRGPPRTALRPVPADRGGLPHDQLPHRARPGRADRGRRQPGAGRGDLPAGPARAAG